MKTVIYLICLILEVVLWFLVSRYDVQMFQQNSYRPERYWRWFRGNDKLAKWKNLFRREQKIKLAYTKRVIRLFVTMAMIYIAVAIAVFVTVGPMASIMAVLVLIIISKIILLLADLINKPLEKAISKWYYNDAAKILKSRSDLIIIGVTGSYGKTSTKNFLYRILSEKYNTLVTPGNFNTTLGIVRTVREQLKPYHQVFIVEMGAKQVGDIKEICDLVHPSIGIVTAVGEMHLETFGNIGNIQKTKFELIRALPVNGLGVINMDSFGIASYKDIPTNCRIVRYGISSEKVDVRAENITYSSKGTSFKALGESFTTNLLGSGNILDILGALVVSNHMGVDSRREVLAVSKIRSIEHRLYAINRGGMIILDDAYNSNPEGAAMALDVIGKFRIPQGARRIVITPGFIEMGSRQEDANKEFGRRIASVADAAIVVNEINRNAIVSGLKDAGFPDDRIMLAGTLSEAVTILNGMVSAGDVVLYENDLPDMFK